MGNNVFIGANTTLLYDVSIGDNVIIGAGSVVTKDIPDGVVAAGVPCKVIGKYDDFKEKMKLKNKSGLNGHFPFKPCLLIIINQPANIPPNCENPNIQAAHTSINTMITFTPIDIFA